MTYQPIEADLCTPHCKLCGDFYAIRRHGEDIPCPLCCCPDCGRLLCGDPSGNGCQCAESKEAASARATSKSEVEMVSR